MALKLSQFVPFTKSAQASRFLKYAKWVVVISDVQRKLISSGP